LKSILTQNRHASYYYTGGIEPKSVILRSWNIPEVKKPSILDLIHRMTAELRDQLVAAYFPKFMDGLASKPSDDLIIKTFNALSPSQTLPSYLAFARQLYYQHQEMEYGIPISNHLPCLNEVMTYLQAQEFQTIVEVRFAPDTTQALCSPGTAGRGLAGTCFIEINVSLSRYSSERIEEVYRGFELILLKWKGRPHLGKKLNLTCRQMEEIYGDGWKVLQELRMNWDPKRKFLPQGNEFLTRLFEPEKH